VPALRCPLCLRAIDSDNDNDNLAGGYTIGEIGGTKELEARWQDKTKSAFSTSMVYAKLIVCLLPTNLNLNRMQGTPAAKRRNALAEKVSVSTYLFYQITF